MAISTKAAQKPTDNCEELIDEAFQRIAAHDSACLSLQQSSTRARLHGSLVYSLESKCRYEHGVEYLEEAEGADGDQAAAIAASFLDKRDQNETWLAMRRLKACIGDIEYEKIGGKTLLERVELRPTYPRGYSSDFILFGPKLRPPAVLLLVQGSTMSLGRFLITLWMR